MKRISATLMPQFALAFIIATVVFGACAPRIKTPAHFAQLRDPGRFEYRAMSSDEVTIALKKRKNEPSGDLEFWTRVIKEKIPLIYGYTYIGEQNVRAGGGTEGKVIEYKVEQEDGKYIEAGGREQVFEAHRKEILSAATSMRL